MKLLDQWHERHVADRRAQVISRHLAQHVPAEVRVLDVGCGDGHVAALLRGRRQDIHVCGLDVKVREQTHIPIEPFDGLGG